MDLTTIAPATTSDPTARGPPGPLFHQHCGSTSGAALDRHVHQHRQTTGNIGDGRYRSRPSFTALAHPSNLVLTHTCTVGAGLVLSVSLSWDSGARVGADLSGRAQQGADPTPVPVDLQRRTSTRRTGGADALRISMAQLSEPGAANTSVRTAHATASDAPGHCSLKERPTLLGGRLALSAANPQALACNIFRILKRPLPRIQMCYHGLEEYLGVLRQLEVAVEVIKSGLPSLVGNQ